MSTLCFRDGWMFAELGVVGATTHEERGILFEPANEVVPWRRAALAGVAVLVQSHAFESD